MRPQPSPREGAWCALVTALILLLTGCGGRAGEIVVGAKQGTGGPSGSFPPPPPPSPSIPVPTVPLTVPAPLPNPFWSEFRLDSDGPVGLRPGTAQYLSPPARGLIRDAVVAAGALPPEVLASTPAVIVSGVGLGFVSKDSGSVHLGWSQEGDGTRDPIGIRFDSYTAPGNIRGSAASASAVKDAIVTCGLATAVEKGRTVRLADGRTACYIERRPTHGQLQNLLYWEDGPRLFSLADDVATLGLDWLIATASAPRVQLGF